MCAALLLVAISCREGSSDDGISQAAEEEARSAVKPPCRGCTLDIPAQPGPRPLLVVMHGDLETAKVAADRWLPAALARGWAVLSLQCPRERGCTETSWYKWAGPARWVIDQVEAVRKQASIDRDRIFLVGWSGGATFIGSNVPAWPQHFAAMVFHGGGQPPAADACPTREMPAYFLVGDRNWAHPAARRLRDYLEKCSQELTWDLLPGADHAAEDKALDGKKANVVLDWLDDHAREPLVSSR